MDLIALLDTRTLAFATGFAGIAMAISMLGLYWAGMRERALLDWAVAGFGYGLGHQAGYLMLTLTTPWPSGVSLAISNTLVAFGHVFVLIGVQRYLRRRVWTAPLLGVVALLAIASLGWGALAAFQLRVAVLSAFYVPVDAIGGLLLWRARAPQLTPYRRILAGILLLHALFLTLRAGYVVLGPASAGTFTHDPVQVAFFVFTMAFVSALALSMALLMFRSQESELQWLVLRDPLTGLYNRRSLGEHAAREVAHSRRYGTPLALVVFDIDHFKQINDSRGHMAGDEAIAAIAQHVASTLRGSDAAFRLGGEEFLLLLPCTGIEGAATVAERLRASLATTPLQALGMPVTASFGVTALLPGEEWASALRRADEAMYRAKREGRNRVVVAAEHAGAAAGAALERAPR
ncbi:MAG TPA: GGDEF domain-containing protein [Lysobacter sp.]|nr:GGDEF domain-containing protein [Lysobacter sp.]